MNVRVGCRLILSILIINVTYDYIYTWTLNETSFSSKLDR